MDTEVKNILSLLVDTFEGKPWHGGPSAREVLKNVQPKQITKKLNGTHSIIELVGHMTAWRNFVSHQLQGNLNYTVTDEHNFPSDKDWPSTLNDFFETQNKLVSLLKHLPANRLMDVVPGDHRSYTLFELLHGIIHHDVYHIGQIALLNKAFQQRSI